MVVKDRMNKKNKQGAAFTDDGFSIGELTSHCTLTLHTVCYIHIDILT